MKASLTLEDTIKDVIPQLFQDDLLCAGVSEGKQGSCQGDSGGPLMYKDDDSRKYIQIAIVEGGVGECGDKDYPGIYVRLDHPFIWNFIASTINPLTEGQTQILLTAGEENTTKENIEKSKSYC
jgi:secreted trypsin-like serine protease